MRRSRCSTPTFTQSHRGTPEESERRDLQDLRENRGAPSSAPLSFAGSRVRRAGAATAHPTSGSSPASLERIIGVSARTSGSEGLVGGRMLSTEPRSGPTTSAAFFVASSNRTRIASFDLIAERCALAEANCNVLRRRGSAHLLNGVDLDALEPSLSQPIANGSRISIAVRRSRKGILASAGKIVLTASVAQ